MSGYKINYLTAHNEILFIEENLKQVFGLPANSGDQRQAQLARLINELIATDFPKLVHILYRVDVSEARLKRMLQENLDADAGQLIAGLVIERLLVKFQTRMQFPPNSAVPDDEKW